MLLKAIKYSFKTGNSEKVKFHLLNKAHLLNFSRKVGQPKIVEFPLKILGFVLHVA